MGGDEHHEHTEAVRAGLSEEVTARQRGGRCGWSRGSQGGGGQGDSQELEFQPMFVSHLSQGEPFLREQAGKGFASRSQSLHSCEEWQTVQSSSPVPAPPARWRAQGSGGEGGCTLPATHPAAL